MINDFSGGLRGLRPPATFFATLRVALGSVNYMNAVAKPLGKWPHSQLHLHNCDLMQRLSGKRPFLAVEGAELTVSDVEQ